jgi:hypothetical protein
MNINIDRRALLLSAGGLTLDSCAHCIFPSPSQTADQVSDAHAHFFSVTDLPVAGFAKFVLIPRHFPGFPDFAYALVDIIAWVAKALALTADAEARQLGVGALSLSGIPNPGDFGREAAKAHRMGLRGEAPVPEVDELEPIAGAPMIRGDVRAESHRALAALLGRTEAGIGNGKPGLTAAEFEAIAAGRSFDARAPGDPDLQCPTNPPTTTKASTLPSAQFLLHWAYQMCRPRCVHVESYLDTIRRDGASVADAVNLLVDFDKWLDDSPRPGSQTDRQVAYWTGYVDVSASVPGRIRLHTFAGYDPLRDAEERVLERRPATSFAAMQQWARNGRDPASRAARRIAGFKVYPPMGFRPDCNASIAIPDLRGGVAIRKRWGAKFEQIGTEIDHSLKDFFAFCVTEDVPIVTHGRESNLAFPENGDDPSPRHWLALAKRLRRDFPAYKPLRINIGHFDMVNCASPQGDPEVLREGLLLNGRRETRIYFDLSFDDRILAGRGSELFAEIGKVCRDVHDDGNYVMFGSDWIMLANQPNAGEYLKLAYAAASQDNFWKDRLDKLFRSNLMRFLDPTAD